MRKLLSSCILLATLMISSVVVVGYVLTEGLTISSYMENTEMLNINRETIATNKSKFNYKSDIAEELKDIKYKIMSEVKDVKYSELDIIGHLGSILANNPEVILTKSNYGTIGDKEGVTVNVAPIPPPVDTTQVPADTNAEASVDTNPIIPPTTPVVESNIAKTEEIESISEVKDVFSTQFNSLIITLESTDSEKLMRVISELEELSIKYYSFNLEVLHDKAIINLTIDLREEV